MTPAIPPSSSTSPKPRILIVDDEAPLVMALTRVLRSRFDVVGAVGAAEGLPLLQREAPFDVVVSDLRMPVMDGATFLSLVRQASPDTVRILLTGQADVPGAMQAVNDGQIFRFLAKPCPADQLVESLRAAVELHRQTVEERRVLEETLRGSVQALLDTLALAAPAAYQRARRLRVAAGALARRVGGDDVASVELAAMLSQLGALGLPAALSAKLYAGAGLDDGEAAAVERMPATAASLLGGIPPLEDVLVLLRGQAGRHDQDAELPMGARVLRVITDAAVLQARGETPDGVVAALRAREGVYDPFVVDAYADMIGARALPPGVREMSLREVAPGMIFDADVRTQAGALLIARGLEVTPALVELIWSFSEAVEVREPVRMRAPRLDLN